LEENQVHQDQRIGLALAVLLLGAAGAFFFRNDPKPTGSSPRLKSGKELDARIAEKSISPYLQNSDEDQEAPGTPAKKVSDRAHSDSSASGEYSLPSLDPPDFFGPEDRAFNGTAGSTRSRSGLITGEDDIQELSPIPFPAANDQKSSVVGSNNARQPQTSRGADRTHVVQKGETLSSIAAKELGSSTRFLEIFEANRDQLSDANDVRVGMTLRIHARPASQDNATVSRPKDRSYSAPPLLPADSGNSDVSELPPIGLAPEERTTAPAKKLFEPAKRPPLGIKGLGTQSSDTGAASKPVRKLTQLPPTESGGKVAR
jgi:hypothetical protein